MEKSYLNKIDWPQLLASLANFAQSKEAKEQLLKLGSLKNKEEILESWKWITSLLKLMSFGYQIKLTDLLPIKSYLRSVELGRILEGEELSNLALVLRSSSQVLEIIKNNPDKESILWSLQDKINPCQSLAKALDKCIDDKGEIKENASPELRQIHHKRSSLARKIQSSLQNQMNHHEATKKYLQDDYFTLRLGRYVLPMRVDVKGRVSGTIIDSSVSSQTLFVEPQNIKSLNDELIELDQLEKIEKMRLLKELSLLVLKDIDALEQNYQELIALDLYTAKACLAQKMQASTVKLSSEPKLALIKAHHPLLYLMDPKVSRFNSISLQAGQKILVISGPNAGGKSIILKTLALTQTMIAAGLLVPCHESSEVYLFNRVFVELGDSQSINDHLSSFSGHMSQLKPILESANCHDLVLLDELASGTEPLTGASIAEAILQDLKDKQATVVVTTHFDQLKFLAFKNKEAYRNGSMEFSSSNNLPTYKLLLDVPGQSYGFELATRVGISAELIKKAQEIKGNKDNSLEILLQDMSRIRDKLRKQEQTLQEQIQENAAAQAKLRAETIKFQERKQQEIKDLRGYYEQKLGKKFEKIATLESEYKILMKKIRSAGDGTAKDLQKLQELRTSSNKTVEQSTRDLRELDNRGKKTDKLPGYNFSEEKARVGDTVFLTHLRKEAEITDLLPRDKGKVEVAIGLLRSKVDCKKLRFLRAKPLERSIVKKTKKANLSKISMDRNTLQSKNNTIDVRGQRSDEALAAVWKFIDSALLKSQAYIYIIHGHGDSNILKDNIRRDLQAHKNLPLAYKAAPQNEGGDGVTIVFLS